MKTNGGRSGGGPVFTLSIPCTASTSSSPPGGGSTSGAGTVNGGSSVTVCATANSCCSFVNWPENINAVSSTNGHTFTATSHRAVAANLAPLSYTIGGRTSGIPTALGQALQLN